jgi:hypothetical protein
MNLRYLCVVCTLVVFSAACTPTSSAPSSVTTSAQPTRPATQEPPATLTPVPPPADIWAGLQAQAPKPLATGLPPLELTPIDGTFAKYDPSWPEWWQCLRCADYRPAGGIWKMRFDRGVMRIYYNVTGWHSLASYSVDGDHLYLFNDPYCPQVTGEYRWHIEDRWGLADRVLVLEAIDDPCSIHLRGKNLAAQEWFNCGPPSGYTGASGHYHAEPACQDIDVARLQAEAPPVPAGLSVKVYPNYVNLFRAPPEVLLAANSETDMPAGYSIRSSDVSIPYGFTRVLWGVNDWTEMTVDAPVRAMGVQIYGKHTMGWARVLFDGAEVWRGDTLALGRVNQDFYDYSYGGYIEVSGFGPGSHTIRVESLGVDYRPVIITHFGASLHGQVVP